MRRSGVTLVELIIVVVIAIILLAVALPLIKYGIDESRLREGARQVNAFFASAKAQAASTNRPAGVWLELERIGDPNAATGLFQCSQLYLAEVPSPYAGDTSDAICLIRQAGPPWDLDFQSTGASLLTLVPIGETFKIQLDFKGHWFTGVRTNTGFRIVPDLSGMVIGNRPPWYGPDGAPGNIGVDDDGNGTIDDFSEWGLGDDAPKSIYAKYKIHRQPQRVGQPLELPQGIVIDPNYSGAGPAVNQFAAAQSRIVIMFDPQGGVERTTLYDQVGNAAELPDKSKLHLLIGRTEQVEYAWQNVAASNIADGRNLWVAINRRTGSIGTIENAPNVSLPISTPAERAVYLSTAREFATRGDVKGGQ